MFPVIVPTTVRSVYDVTGAGDMVLAALAAARANGVSWTESVRFANAAAAMSVTVIGPRGLLPTWAEVDTFLEEN